MGTLWIDAVLSIPIYFINFFLLLSSNNDKELESGMEWAQEIIKDWWQMTEGRLQMIIEVWKNIS